MKNKELHNILCNHADWSRGEGGERMVLKHVNMNRARLVGAYMKDAILDNVQLKRVSMSEAYCSHATLTNLDMTGASLDNACFLNADLRGTNFLLANLRGACFENANLEGVNFDRAYLKGANMKGAKLDGARLNWSQSCLILEILWSRAGQDVEKQKSAAHISVLMDRSKFNWRQYMESGDPSVKWVYDVLLQWANFPPTEAFGNH